MTQESKDALEQFLDDLIQRLLECREIVMSQFNFSDFSFL